jgi:Domain of unknown function (DUF4124)
MRSSRITLRSWLAVLALLCCVPVLAATVYKTVDAGGVVSYSDTPPPGDVPVETMEIDVVAPELSETEQERLQAMRETTDRMAADRREREQHRARLRQQQAESQSQPQYQQADYPDYLGYSSGYYSGYRYPRRRPGGGWHKPGPEHPIARPPLRPPGQGHRPQVLPARPSFDYPASLVRKHYSPEVRAAFEK